MQIEINLYNALNTADLIYDDEALSLHSRLDNELMNKKSISLSFEKINLCSSLFMNALLGPLYGKYGSEVDQFIHFKDITDDNIKNVIDRVRTKALKSSIYSPLFEEAYSK